MEITKEAVMQEISKVAENSFVSEVSQTIKNGVITTKEKIVKPKQKKLNTDMNPEQFKIII